MTASNLPAPATNETPRRRLSEAAAPKDVERAGTCGGLEDQRWQGWQWPETAERRSGSIRIREPIVYRLRLFVTLAKKGRLEDRERKALQAVDTAGGIFKNINRRKRCLLFDRCSFFSSGRREVGKKPSFRTSHKVTKYYS